MRLVTQKLAPIVSVQFFRVAAAAKSYLEKVAVAFFLVFLVIERSRRSFLLILSCLMQLVQLICFFSFIFMLGFGLKWETINSSMQRKSDRFGLRTTFSLTDRRWFVDARIINSKKVHTLDEEALEIAA